MLFQCDCADCSAGRATSSDGPPSQILPFLDAENSTKRNLFHEDDTRRCVESHFEWVFPQPVAMLQPSVATVHGVAQVAPTMASAGR